MMKENRHILNILMGGVNMSSNDHVKLPEVMVFAGPNGSGKATITRMAKTVGEYINADDIKKTTLCSELEAAIKAEELRVFIGKIMYFDARTKLHLKKYLEGRVFFYLIRNMKLCMCQHIVGTYIFIHNSVIALVYILKLTLI